MDTTKYASLTVSLSLEQQSTIKIEAAKAGLSVADYMRQKLGFQPLGSMRKASGRSVTMPVRVPADIALIAQTMGITPEQAVSQILDRMVTGFLDQVTRKAG